MQHLSARLLRAVGTGGEVGLRRPLAARSMREPPHVIELGERDTGRSGAADEAWETGLALSRIGFPVAVVTPQDGRTGGCCDTDGVEWHALPLRSVIDVASMRRLAHLARARRTSLVHVHGPVSLAIALGATALGAGFRIVVRRSRTFPVRLAARLVLRARRVARIVATCDAVRQVVIDTARVTPEKVEVARPGVDLERFDPRRTRPTMVRQELGIPPQARVLIHVGMRDWKGWREVLTAFPSIRAACPEAHLLLVGCRRDEQRRWILGLAHEMGVAEGVTVALFREDMADVLACAEMLVDASWAGTGIARALCEAMALGRPVVATSCGGTPELIEDGRTGLLVPPRDTATLVAAVVRLLRDVELAATLAASGQSHVVANLNSERRARRLAAIYDASIA